jgi:hypothetical protein
MTREMDDVRFLHSSSCVRDGSGARFLVDDLNVTQLGDISDVLDLCLHFIYDRESGILSPLLCISKKNSAYSCFSGEGKIILLIWLIWRTSKLQRARVRLPIIYANLGITLGPQTFAYTEN